MNRVAKSFVTVMVALTGCGGESYDAPTATTEQPIVGGYVDEVTSGVVGVAFDFGGDSVFTHCSGSLIAPNLVLTARHCVALTEGTPDDHVECGVTHFTVQGAGDYFLVSPETVAPTSVTDPHLYRGSEVRAAPGADDMCGYDVALIILQGKGVPAAEATPLVPRVDARPTPTEEFSAAGYGITSPDGFDSGVRMRVDGSTVECVGPRCLGVEATEWLSLDVSACSGDSGGPALDLQGRVIGVASRGEVGCISTVYGDVASWGDFIIQTALDAAAQGNYEPPFWTSGSSVPPPPEPEPAPVEEPVTMPEAPLLGSRCDGPCDDGYACFSESATPPGICVPRCGDGRPACPDGYVCASDFNLCAPEDSDTARAARDTGCSVGGQGASGTPLVFLALGLVLLARRRSVRPQGGDRKRDRSVRPGRRPQTRPATDAQSRGRLTTTTCRAAPSEFW